MAKQTGPAGGDKPNPQQTAEAQRRLKEQQDAENRRRVDEANAGPGQDSGETSPDRPQSTPAPEQPQPPPQENVSQEPDPAKDRGRVLPRQGGDAPASGQDPAGRDDPLKDVPAIPSPNPQDSSLKPRPGVGGTTLQAAHPEQFGPPAGPASEDEKMKTARKKAKGGPVYRVTGEWLGGPALGALVTKQDLGKDFSYAEHVERGTITPVEGMEGYENGERSAQEEVDRLTEENERLRDALNSERVRSGRPPIHDWEKWNRDNGDGPV